MRHLAPREVFHSQLSLNNIVNRTNCREGVLCNYSGAGKCILLHKCLSCGPKVKKGRPDHGESLRDKSPFLNF
jgi:hypothetical protein